MNRGVIIPARYIDRRRIYCGDSLLLITFLLYMSVKCIVMRLMCGVQGFQSSSRCRTISKSWSWLRHGFDIPVKTNPAMCRVKGFSHPQLPQDLGPVVDWWVLQRRTFWKMVSEIQWTLLLDNGRWNQSNIIPPCMGSIAVQATGFQQGCWLRLLLLVSMTVFQSCLFIAIDKPCPGGEFSMRWLWREETGSLFRR